MTTLAHQPSDAAAERRWRRSILARDVWVSLSITVIWVVVLLDALFGPDIIVSNASGFTRLPSAVIVVFFAYLATRVVAKWGFSRPPDAMTPSAETEPAA